MTSDSPLLWVFVGAGGWLIFTLVISAVVDHDVRDGLARAATAVLIIPAVLVTIPPLALPAFRRRRVTADTLRDALDDDRFQTRVTAVLWPGHAIVLLRSRPAASDSPRGYS